MINKNRNEKGFALVMIPVIFVMVSLFIVLTMQPTQVRSFYSEVDTEKKIDKVSTSLATYAHRNYRLPCPASPNLEKDDPLFGAETVGCDPNDGFSQNGIIPFKELGLTVADIKDSWGNYLSYTVSPRFTKKVEESDFAILNNYHSSVSASDDYKLLVADGGNAEKFVHGYCRGGDWVTQKSSHISKDGTEYALNSAEYLSNNIFKAQFCCASSSLGASTPTVWDSTTNRADFDTDMVGSKVYSYTYSDGGVDKFSIKVKEYNEYFDTPKGLPGVGFDYDRDPTSFDLGGKDHPIGFGEFYNDAYFNTPSDPSLLTSWGLGLGWSYKKLGSKYPFIEILEPGTVTSINVVLGEIAPYDIGNKFAYFVEFINIRNGVTIRLEEEFDTIIKGTPDDPSLDDIGNITISRSANLIAAIDDHNLSNPLDPITLDEMYINNLALAMNSVAIFGYYVGDPAINNQTSYVLMGMELNNDNSSGPSNDIELLNKSDNNILSSVNDPSNYAAADNTSGAIADNVEVPAYIIVSHGANGFGAYYDSNTDGDTSIELAQRMPTAGEVAGTKEAANYDGDLSFYIMPKVNKVGDVNNYDDIVKWDSQITLYSSLSGATCSSANSY